MDEVPLKKASDQFSHDLIHLVSVAAHSITSFCAAHLFVVIELSIPDMRATSTTSDVNYVCIDDILVIKLVFSLYVCSMLICLAFSPN